MIIYNFFQSRIPFIIFLVSFFLCLNNKVNSQDSIDTCIVVNKASVFEEPDLNSERISFVEKGSKLIVLDKVKSFYEIQISNIIGYVQFVNITCSAPISWVEREDDRIKKAPNGTRGIIVKLKSDSLDIFQTVLRRLVEFGYGIDKYDKDFGFIQTKPSSSKETFGEVVFYILLTDTGFKIKGDYREFKSSDYVNPWEEIRKEGVNAELFSSMRGTFTEMFDFAASFGSNELTFWKKD
jgi:hypothetical protein